MFRLTQKMLMMLTISACSCLYITTLALLRYCHCHHHNYTVSKKGGKMLQYSYTPQVGVPLGL